MCPGGPIVGSLPVSQRKFLARILITGFCSFPGPHRVGVQLGHVVEALERSHQVDVLCLRSPGQGHNERVGASRVLRVATAGETLPEQVEAFQRALRRQIEGDNYDIVHFRDGWTGITALNLQAKHGYAAVFDLARSPMSERVLSDLVASKELERAVERSVRRSDLVLVATETSRQELARDTELAKLHVVPPGVNVDRFDWEPTQVDAVPVVLYMGSLQPGCGIRLLLGAFADVALESDAILVLAGHASQTFHESVQRMVVELELAGRVRMLGEVLNEVAPAVIARSTVCVAPIAADLDSVPTALFPTKLLEYMACKRAVVAPRRSSVQAFMRDEEHGLYFDPGSPKDLARSILRILDQPGLRGRLAQSGYDLVRSHHSASATRRSLRSAYESILRLERFTEMGLDATKTGSITDLGLDVTIGERAKTHKQGDYDDDTDIFMEDANEHSDGGDVTQVQLRAAEPADPRTTVPADPRTTVPADPRADVTPHGQRLDPRGERRRGAAADTLEQTRLVSSPFATSEKTVGGEALAASEFKTTLASKNSSQPAEDLPPPRAPRLPKKRGRGGVDPSGDSRGEGGKGPKGGKISGDKRH